MLSRVSHVVLVIAVVVLSIALVRTRNHSPSPVSMNPSSTAAPVAREAEPEQASILPASLITDLDMLAMASDDLAWNGAKAAPVGGPWTSGRLDQAPQPSSRDSDDRLWMHGPRLTSELVNRCVEVAKEVDSELGNRLAEARDKNPAEFDSLMRQGGVGRRLLAMAQLKQHDPDLYHQKLDELSNAVQIDRVAKQWREAQRTGSQGDVDVYEAQLRTLLQIQLALSIKARGDILCRLDDRIADLRKQLERDAMNFTSIIDARLKVFANDPSSASTPPSPDTPAEVKPEQQPARQPVG